MPLVSGTKLGPYEIVSPLGAGGMGEVYRARDQRLGRDVALKVLPEAFAGDAQRMARFEREAKVLASLNHPNIAVLYGFEESSGTRALVMELVEGPTLDERIKQGTLGLEEALLIAKQIAEALEYAHERGIIHRDLKPSNVKLTEDGQVKLLDFGLAKALEGETSQEELQNSPTLSAAATRAGVMLGTAAYMAPEQARGKRVDRRADIWAFGCVLYEMLAGRDAFGGETTSDILACVIRAEPDWSSIPASVPRRIQELVRRCLQKDPKQRLQAIGEARITVDGAVAGSSDEAAAAAQTTRPRELLSRRALPWGVAAVGLAVTMVFGGLLLHRRPPDPPPVMRASLLLPEPLGGVFSANPGSPIVLSPDGSRLVFVGSPAGKPPQLYLRQLDQQTATPIANTEEAVQPFFSADGQWVGFFANSKLMKIDTATGVAQQVCDAPGSRTGAWNKEGIILFANFGRPLQKVAAFGGVMRGGALAAAHGPTLADAEPAQHAIASTVATISTRRWGMIASVVRCPGLDVGGIRAFVEPDAEPLDELGIVPGLEDLVELAPVVRDEAHAFDGDVVGLPPRAAGEHPVVDGNLGTLPGDDARADNGLVGLHAFPNVRDLLTAVEHALHR